MTDPQAAAAEAAEILQRAIALVTPNATDVHTKDVHHYPHKRELQIDDFRAEFADGSTVQAPHITIQLG